MAGDMRKHVRKLLNAQRDILPAQAISGVETALAGLQKALDSGEDDEALKKQMAALETAANKWLRPYPNATIRENVEVLLVALAVAMAIRTFVLQPFKIPTGSMQPTLFGVTPSPGTPAAGNRPDLVIPGRIARFFDYWIHGESYFDVVAPETGRVEALRPPTKLLLFNLWQEFEFNGQWRTVWFPADDLFARAGYGYGVDTGGSLPYAPTIKAGDPIIRIKVLAGDHLFVDRVSYNFRHPKRGEIIVFETRGIPTLPQGEFYIMRLVALGGEHVQIGSDRHLVINGQRLDSSTPHFKNVYGFDPNEPPRESHYSGHVYRPDLAPQFADSPGGVFTVRPEHYMVMGDNTMNSSDSRVWGDFSETNVIGKYFFVYWPFSSRFGWNVQ